VDLPVIKENDNMKTDMGDGPFPVDKDGFIRHWLVSGPFPNPGGRPYGTAENQKGFDNDFLSQLGGEVCVLPKAGQKTATEFPVTSEGYWNNFKGRYECAWKKIYSKSGRVDLLPEFTISDNTLAYACCYIESPEERDVKVKLGSDDGYKVWFNNVLLGGKNICRGVMEDSEEYRVHIKKGFVLNDRNLNVLLLKIIQDTGGWGFVARITDLDDKPLTDLKIWLAPAK
jgi:hypothetical protein